VDKGSQTQTLTVVARYVTEELLHGSLDGLPDPDESLIRTGILDSSSVLKLLLFIEEHFNVTITDSEVTPMNFETLNRITAFIDGKARQQPHDLHEVASPDQS
jgi:acyl carrier protein